MYLFYSKAEEPLYEVTDQELMYEVTDITPQQDNEYL